ncbi:MAG: hypothetical protein BTM30_07315 [Synechococcus lacustris str. Tous]|nr:MAG: hypothetical protein BTM30_07315 [Synechococcus lacustris str. Tous]
MTDIYNCLSLFKLNKWLTFLIHHLMVATKGGGGFGVLGNLLALVELPLTYLVAAFYKFAQLDNLESLRQKLLKNAEIGGLQGTLLLAAEGINATLCGSEIGIKDFIDLLRKEEAFNELEVKYSWSAKKCFHRLKIRIKSEIVTIGIPELNPQQQVGNYVQPQRWDDLIKQPNTLVIDTRNNYEIAVGSFPGAIDPGLDNFRGFPAWVEQELKPLMKKHKAERLALFCTGGIRCEKATALLVAQGFSDVHHLEGGILKYLEQIPAERSSWQGDCFVFDQRVALNHQLAPSEYSLCYACGMPLAAADRALSSYVAGVSCRHCKENFSEADRQRFAERQQQMQLAAARGENHLGSNSLSNKQMPSLADLEAFAAQQGLILRLQIGGGLGLKTLRVAVARRDAGRLLLLGELKGWSLPFANGLHLDTLRVQGNQLQGVADLIWAATFAWALEQTPCRRANLLAIRDNSKQHQKLVRYFRRLGFTAHRELAASPIDLPLRLVWGGSGLLMRGDCTEGLARSSGRIAMVWPSLNNSASSIDLLKQN